MKPYKIIIQQNVKQWYSMPVEVEIMATDAATAIVLAYERFRKKGIYVNGFHLLT
jgi:hypothetical protein